VHFSADRSLESIDAMFSTSSPFYSKMEEAYHNGGDGNVLAARGLSIAEPPKNARQFAIAEILAHNEKESLDGGSTSPGESV
jgi:hypothetical protein